MSATPDDAQAGPVSGSPTPPGGGPVGPPPSWDVVVPTVGRASLVPLLASLGHGVGHGLGAVVVVDDRRSADRPLLDPRAVPEPVASRICVVRGGARGPAAARNRGWRATGAPWVVFVDDDVGLPAAWFAALVADLASAGPAVAGVQGAVDVPLPAVARPTDQQRAVRGLASARWATADMAYRRAALRAASGFDERFPRAYREDSDLALRLLRAGWTLTTGTRRCVHPALDAPWTASLTRQRGNADDALMRRLHGRRWRADADAPPGRRPVHVATVGAALVAGGAGAARRRRLAGAASIAWALATAQFALTRIAPGPRTAREVSTMAVTSVAIPPLAVGWWLRGRLVAGRPTRPVATSGPASRRD